VSVFSPRRASWRVPLQEVKPTQDIANSTSTNEERQTGDPAKFEMRTTNLRVIAALSGCAEPTPSWPGAAPPLNREVLSISLSRVLQLWHSWEKKAAQNYISGVPAKLTAECQTAGRPRTGWRRPSR
jgi:hypothetical protein